MIEQAGRHVPKIYRRENCRLCLNSNLTLLFALKPTPPAEWYFRGDARQAAAVPFPLDLYFCEDCKHVQLLDVIDPIDLFTNYFYESKTSPGLLDHFAKYATRVAEICQLSPESLVVDVGSNDGTLLENFKQLGFKVVGVEPSYSLSQMCNTKGIKTYNSFLNTKIVETILRDNGDAALVTANNVFAHNDDLHNMAKCVSMLLAEGGIFIFEVSSVLHTMTGMVIDYIYHEHLSYHSLISLEPFLKLHSLQLLDVEIIDTKGGSYRVYAQKSSNPVKKSGNLIEALRNEISSGIDSPDFYKGIYHQISQQKNQLHEYLKGLPRDAVIAGYGASATSTTLVYEFDLIEIIEYLVDDNPIRHGNYLPGTNLKVHGPDYLLVNKPTHVIILAWRFSQMITSKLIKRLPEGVTFIVPLPKFETLRIGE